MEVHQSMMERPDFSARPQMETDMTGSTSGLSEELDASLSSAYLLPKSSGSGQTEVVEASTDTAELTLSAKDAEREAHLPDMDLVGFYLRQIGKIPLLDDEEEVAVAREIEAGLFAQERIDKATEQGTLGQLEDAALLRIVAQQGQQAYKHMINANLRLVVSIAKRYVGRGLDLLDLIQEGNTGLLRAVEKFDPDKGFKFSTYATWWIRQFIVRGIQNKARSVALPVWIQNDWNKYSSEAERLERQLGRPPTDEELAKEFNTTPEKIEEAREAHRSVCSLDQPVGDASDNITLGDFIKNPSPRVDAQVVTIEASREVQRALGYLTPEERQIVQRRFLDDPPKTLTEIQDELGIKPQRVRKLTKSARSKLADPSYGLSPDLFETSFD